MCKLKSIPLLLNIRWTPCARGSPMDTRALLCQVSASLATENRANFKAHGMRKAHRTSCLGLRKSRQPSLHRWGLSPLNPHAIADRPRTQAKRLQAVRVRDAHRDQLLATSFVSEGLQVSSCRRSQRNEALRMPACQVLHQA